MQEPHAPPPRAEILSQGDEVVTGQVADTNAAWLSTRLTELGFTVTRHTSVGDRLPDLQAALKEISGRCELCIGTGGLGPTDDDLTAEAVAATFEAPLAFDEVAMATIEGMYRRFGREMPEVNRKQAWIPSGAVRLDNEWGTAPGFAVEREGTLFAFMPGVPREMKPMFEARVLPLLSARLQVTPGRLVTLRTTGIGESNIQERLGRFARPGAVLSYRTKLPENHIKIRFEAHVPSEEVAAVVADLRERIGSPVFSVEGLRPDEAAAIREVDTVGGDLSAVVGRALAARGETVATAESCTGGRIGAYLTSMPGSSAWFMEGAITYSNESKLRSLGVDPEAIAAHGAVSEVVARQMAERIRARAATTYGLAVTGIAGPGGGSEDKPVGTVHIALATPAGTHHRLLRLPGTRDRTQTLAASGALDLLRRFLFQHL